MNMIFRPGWILRFFFPVLFLVLFTYDLFRFVHGYFPFHSMNLFDWVMFALELIILYNMVFFLTVRYEISDNELIVYSFLFRHKEFQISNIIFIEEEGMLKNFFNSSLGPDWATVHFKGGKKLQLLGLSEHYKFVQLLKGKSG